MLYEAFEKIKPFLLLQCYGPLINVDAQSQRAPLLSQLPWEGYRANEFGDMQEKTMGRWEYTQRMSGNFHDVPFSIESLRLQQQWRGKSWYTKEHINPSKIQKLSELSVQQCVEIAHSCIERQRQFIKEFANGHWDEDYEIKACREQEDVGWRWVGVFETLASAPIEWLMSLPHIEGVEYYVDQMVGAVLDPMPSWSSWIEGAQSGAQMQQEDKHSERYEKWEHEERLAFLTRPKALGFIGMYGLMESVARALVQEQTHQNPVLKQPQNMQKMVEKMYQMEQALWSKKSAYLCKNEWLVPVYHVFGPLVSMIRKRALDADQLDTQLINLSLMHGSKNQSYIDRLPLLCVRKASALEQSLPKKRLHLEQVKKQSEAQEGTDALVSQVYDKKCRTLEEKIKQSQMQQQQWIDQAVKGIALKVHEWNTQDPSAGNVVYESCAAFLPQSCTPQIGVIRRKRTYDVTLLGSKWAEEERYGFSPLGYMPQSLLQHMPLALLYGLISETQSSSGQYKNIQKYVMSRFDQNGQWIKESEKKEVPEGLAQLLEEARQHPEPKGKENWALNKKQWLQLLVGLALKNGDQKVLKQYLLDKSLDGSSLSECLDLCKGRTLMDPLDLLEYGIESKKFEWLKKVLIQGGVQETEVKNFVRGYRTEKKNAFENMLNGWCAQLKSKKMQRELKEQGAVAMRKTKNVQKRL